MSSGGGVKVDKRGFLVVAAALVVAPAVVAFLFDSPLALGAAGVAALFVIWLVQHLLTEPEPGDPVRPVVEREPISDEHMVGSITAVAAETRLANLLTNVGTRHSQIATQLIERIDVSDAGSRHVAERLKRSAESLVVLSGEEIGPGPSDGPAVPLRKIISLALGSSDDLGVVDHESIEPAQISSEAADDLTMLLAELIDNSITWAKEGTKVVITGRPTPDGYLVSITDEGRSLNDQERARINANLAAPAPLTELPNGFGLAITSRLAKRHGLEVRLLEAPTDGVMAKIRLPDSMVDTAAGSRRESKDDGRELAHSARSAPES